MSYELFIAKRYLRAKRKTGFISIITYISISGVVIGVAALIIVLSVMNGFESEVRSRIIGADAHIRVATFHNQGIEDYPEVIKKIRNLPHIAGISPFIDEKAMVKAREGAEGIFIRGVDPSTVGTVSDLPKNIVAGKLDLGLYTPLSEKPLPGIILGRGLADRLSILNMGEKVTVISPTFDYGPFSQPAVKQFYVTGIFETGMFEYDATFAYVSLQSAQQLFQLGKKVAGLEIKLDHMDNAEKVSKQIDEQLGYPFWPRTWAEMHQNLFAWMKIEKWAAFIILCLIIMVAAFNIISSLIMIVMEKTREIGILKSMGASSRGIMRIFVLEGLVIGILGALLGSVIGYVLCWSQLEFKWFSLPSDIYFITSMPVLMKPSDFIAINLAAIILCLLASVYPAWKASQLVPVEAIRYE